MLHQGQPDAEEKWVAVIRDYTAYLDPSGTHDGSPVVAVAGFVAPARNWARLTKGWVSILRTWGLPYFHMAEFASARGKLFGRFSGDEDAQNRLIHPLAKLVRDHVTVAFAGSVEVRHIEAAVPAELREWFAPLPTAFQVCMQVLIKRWAEKRVPAREQLGVIFDQDNCPRMLQLHAAYNQLTAVWDETGRLGPVQFADKKRVIPLQTADMLAHQVFRHLKDGLPETGEIRNVLRWMLEGVREQYVTTIDEAGLATVVAKMLRQRPDRPPTT